MERASYNWLREELKKGFDKFLAHLPEGDGDVLTLEVKQCGDTVKSILEDGYDTGELLEDVLHFVNALRRGNRTSEEIRIILDTRGALQRILLCDEYVGQDFLD